MFAKSVAGSVTGQGFATRPADASQKELSEIKKELAMILKDPQSDDMSHEQIQEEVNYALETKYAGKEWTDWFKRTIGQLSRYVMHVTTFTPHMHATSNHNKIDVACSKQQQKQENKQIILI